MEPQKLENPDRKMIVNAVVSALGVLRDGKARTAVIVIHLPPDAQLDEATCDHIVGQVTDLNTVTGEKFHKGIHSWSADGRKTLKITLMREILSEPIVP